MLLQKLILFFLDLFHLQFPFHLSCFLTFSLISLLLFVEVVHQYSDDNDRIISVIVSKKRSFVNPQDDFLQSFIASLSKDDDK